MTWRRTGWASVVLLGAVGVGSWWTGHAPVALLAASYVALLGLLSRALPVRIAASAAFVAQQAVLLALELLVPAVLGGPLRPEVALAVLVLPCLAVVPDVLLGRPAGGGAVSWPAVAAVVGGVVLVATVLAAGRDEPLGTVAWAGSGDARNHFLFVRLILAEGGLHGDALSFQPLHQETLTALLVDTRGRGSLGAGDLLERDLLAFGRASLALAVAWTLAAAAAVAGLGRLRASAAPVTAVASLLPLTGVGLGVALKDGFLSILLLVPLLLCTLVVLGWLATTRRRGAGVTVAVGVTAAAVPVAAFTWTPLAVVLGGAALLPWWRAVRTPEHRTARVAMVVAGVAGGAAYTVYVVTTASRLLDAYGAIEAPPPLVAALVPVLVLVVAVGRLTSLPVAVFAPYLAGSVVALVVTLSLVVMQPDEARWNYLPAKLAWVWLLVGLPLLLAPFAHPRRDGRPVVAVGISLGAVLVLVAATFLSPLPTPVGRGERTIGAWTNPDGRSLRLAVDLADPSARYVVFEVRGAEDRMTNFWLVVQDGDTGPSRGNVFFMWAYGSSGGAAEVCDLLDAQPVRVVATSNPRAEGRLRRACGRDVAVRVVGD